MSTHAAIPAVRRTVRVERSVEDAFRVFTEGVGSWWPVESHSIGKDHAPAQTAVMESGEGGRFYERNSDGSEATWGTILVWEPPHRIVISWQLKPERPATEVDVQFTPDGDGTLVELEHRGWERLGDEAEEVRASYGGDGGWVTVLGRFAEAA